VFIVGITASAEEGVMVGLVKIVEERVGVERATLDVMSGMESVGRILGIGSGRGKS
jgi:hypothetical protein